MCCGRRPFLFSSPPPPQSMLLLDGGLSSWLEELLQAPLHRTLWSAGLLASDEGRALICSAHADFLRAGAQILQTVSYQATTQGFIDAGVCATEEEGLALIRLSVSLLQSVIARDEAADASRERSPAPKWAVRRKALPLIAGSIGPYGAYLANGAEYRGNYGKSAEEIQAFHLPKVRALAECADCDVLAFETNPDHSEVLAIADLMKRHFPEMPYWITFQCRDAAHIACGEEIERTCESILRQVFIEQKDRSPASRLVGLGVNCVSPCWVPELVGRVRAVLEKFSDERARELEVICYPNRGETWDGENREWIATPQTLCADNSLGAEVKRWAASGATIVGGCCRVTPEQIERIHHSLSEES